MFERLKSVFELDGESEREDGVVLGMSPLETVVALVLVLFILDMVLNDADLLQMVLGLF